MLERTRARLTTKIRSKLNSCRHEHFTEHLADVFRKEQRESDWNRENLELSDTVAKEQHQLHPATINNSSLLEQHLNNAEIALDKTSKLRNALWAQSW
jgi:hypothetical protein